MVEDSVKTTIKNDIKTTFLIANCFNALVAGLFPISLGASLFLIGEPYQSPAYCAMAVGVPLGGLSAFGFYASFKENRNMLTIYSVLMGLVAAAETLVVAAQMLPDVYVDNVIYVHFCIFHIGIALSVLASALCLAKQIPSDTFKTSSQSSCKWLGYGLLIVLLLGYFVKFV
ncbi:uncharacterized protein LOC125235265 [Leguminivora glycinivorella]|uniref:uncharacterized protein LOC125235265 n=1 Tax=Leguminivora glycinivorella TaxID=1035111 RepID=UPI00200D12BA|nr:uncharacterized protein LOC125235265 [Leguminivora glycinivorella]